METTNTTGDLSIDKAREYPVVEDGTWEAEYKGFRPFKEDGQWGHKEGVRLNFKVTKGPHINQFVSFKGNFFQDNQSGKWIIGRKSMLAEAIRAITGGSESLTKGHEGTRVFVQVHVNTTKTGPNAGKRYSNVKTVIPMPKDYSAPAPTPQAQPVAAAPKPATPPQQPATQTVTRTEAPAKNADLLDSLSEMSDFKD